MTHLEGNIQETMYSSSKLRYSHALMSVTDQALQGLSLGFTSHNVLQQRSTLSSDINPKSV